VAEPQPSYVLRRGVIGSRGAVDIDEAQYLAIRQAGDGVDLLASIEEKFDILFENFIELEEEISRIVLHEMYRSLNSYPELQTLRVRISRRVVNLLTAGRLYTDQLQGDLKRGRKLGLAVDVEALVEAARNGSFEFRLVEAIRNVVQHRALPVDAYRFGGRWLDEDGRPWKAPLEAKFLRHSADFYIRSATLQNDRLLDRKFLATVAKRGEQISLLPVLRAYMDAIGRIHEQVRKSTEAKREEWRGLIQNAMAVYSDAYPAEGRPIGLQAGRKGSGHALSDKVDVFESPFEHLDAFLAKNRNLGNVSTRFMTTQADLA